MIPRQIFHTFTLIDKKRLRGMPFKQTNPCMKSNWMIFRAPELNSRAGEALIVSTYYSVYSYLLAAKMRVLTFLPPPSHLHLKPCLRFNSMRHRITFSLHGLRDEDIAGTILLFDCSYSLLLLGSTCSRCIRWVRYYYLFNCLHSCSDIGQYYCRRRYRC